MIQQLLHALVHSKNEAADDVLVDALKVGNAQEKQAILNAILERQSIRSLCGVVGQYSELPPPLQEQVLGEVKTFHGALREAGRSSDVALRLAALRLIALGRQGKLSYVLSENLHDANPILSKAATEATVALARWVAMETRKLQKGAWLNPDSAELNHAFDAPNAQPAKNVPAPLAAIDDDIATDETPTRRPRPGKPVEDADAQDGNSGRAMSEPRGASSDSSHAVSASDRAASDSGRALSASNRAIPANISASTFSSPADSSVDSPNSSVDAFLIYTEVMTQRPEIEAAVARALDVHRGRHGQDLLRAALLLCDWPGSKTLAILHTAKHGGQSPMVRRLQQPPASEHVEAFLLGASHGQLRSHFGIAFSHINEAPVLDALLRKTHWLRDHQLQLCMHQVSRGVWFSPGELMRDIDRRTPGDAAKVGEWISASGAHDVVQDERLEKLLHHCAESFEGRLRLLRIAARRKRGSSVQLLRAMLNDSDERLMRMAAREIIRRRPTDFENMLLQLMTNAPESVRQIVSRAIGQVGFDQYWSRFDRLDRPMRKQAGRAMLKILPDAAVRLKRRLVAGPPEQRIKAMQMSQELGLAEELKDAIVALCSDGNPRLRSKAISVLREVKSVPAEVVVERLVNDNDARVRANAIEVMEGHPQAQLLPVLAQRALASNNRERANAIKALHRMRVGTAGSQLVQMLRDARPEHRISALWTLRQIGWWQMLNEVGRLAKDDTNVKVRRYALGVLKGVAEIARTQQKEQAG